MISRADGIDDTLKHTKYSGRLANVIRIIQIYIWKPVNCSSTPLKTKNKKVFLNIDENQSIKSNNWLRKRALTMIYTYIDY